MNKGTIGYIDQVKRKNLSYAVIGLSLMAIIYFAGLIIVGDNGSSWTLMAVLLALPAAQFLTRYLSLKGFKSLKSGDILQMDHLAPEAIAYELALVIGKKTYFCPMAVITDNTISLYSQDLDITVKIVKSLLKQKGFQCQVQVYKDLPVFLDAVKQGKMMDVNKTQALRKMLIGNAL